MSSNRIAEAPVGCVVCRLSRRAYTVWDSVYQKGRTGVNRVVDGVTDSARRFQERISIGPELQNNGGNNTLAAAISRRAASVYTSAATWVANQKEFVRKNTTTSLFCGSTLLILATYAYLSPLSHDAGDFHFFLLVSFVGAMFIWVPVWYWLCERNDDLHMNQDAERNEHEKPPPYESLTHPTADQSAVDPPTYEEVYLGNADAQMLLPNSNAVCIGIPLCPVHRVSNLTLPVNNRRTQQERLNWGIHPRSISLGNLYGAESELLPHGPMPPSEFP